MNLINKKVTHKFFGMGSIVKQTESSVEINFSTENKLFVFPDVFGKHLELHDQSAAIFMKEINQKKEAEQEKIEKQKEEERQLQRMKQELRLEHERLMNQFKLHPESQMVFWCDAEEKTRSFSEWRVFSGVVKSGNDKGKPNKPIRLHQNSAVLLTEKNSNMPGEERRILGVYMVNEEFIGKLCEDGYISAHSKYKLQLTEQESYALPSWDTYLNKNASKKTSWNTGKYRYFQNSWMAQILLDIALLKNDPKEREQAHQFLKHFCKMNKIIVQELPNYQGLSRAEN